MKEKRDVVAIDLFCGAGGLTRGLMDAGIRVVKGIDLDDTAANTYEKNNPGAKFMPADIRTVNAADLMDGVERKGADLLIAGCAPCQPFSKHTSSNGGKRRDPRRTLIMCFADIVAKIRPEYVLVENVPGFGKKDNPYHRKLTNLLKKCGYRYDERVINAADYGVPQSRKRYVLLGCKNHDIRIPCGRYGKTGRSPKTVRDAISRYPSVSAGMSSESMPNHAAMRLSDLNMERIKAVPKNGGSMSDLPAHMQTRCYRNRQGHTDTYGRMRWDRPSPTLTCRCNSLSNGRFGHPVQNRAITVREAAALQTFSDDYTFYSSTLHNATHVGNAVPVMLAKSLGMAVMRNGSLS